MSAWKAFYEGREGHSYLQYVKQRYAPFIRAIQDRFEAGDLVLELGAGTGTITKALCEGTTAVRYVASDIDPEMVQIARQRLSDDNVAVFVDSAHSSSTKADVVHSHGMLEHFNDDAIRECIRAHSHARVQVHYVPGLYDEPTFGDERLLPVQEWWDIAKPDQIITFNGGLDYALIFER
jgi:SAM-dependent methyltransferase